MKCVYCQDKSGLLKRVCSDCVRLIETYKTLPPSYGYRELLDTLLGTGISSGKIEKFLMTDVDGSGSINDHLTARMTNEVMAGLGQPSHMTGPDVKKVRQDIAEGKAPSKTDHDVTDYSQIPHKH